MAQNTKKTLKLQHLSSIPKITLTFLIITVRVIAMPTECTTNPLQRDLADSIIMMLPLDEIRILLACGAKVT